MSTPPRRASFLAGSATRAHWGPWAPLVGGIAGLMQALPIRTGVSCCCTPWVALAAIFAVMVIVNRARARMAPEEGALVGLITGAVGGLVGGVVAGMREMLFASTGFIGPFLLDEAEPASPAIVRFLWAGASTFALYLVVSPPLGAVGGAVGAALAKPPGGPPPFPPTRPPAAPR